MGRTFISYLRVSTGRQGKSGLGMEAQREAIARFAEAEGLTCLRSSSKWRPARAPTRSIAGPSWRPPWTGPPGRSAVVVAKL